MMPMTRVRTSLQAKSVLGPRLILRERRPAQYWTISLPNARQDAEGEAGRLNSCSFPDLLAMTAKA